MFPLLLSQQQLVVDLDHGALAASVSGRHGTLRKYADSAWKEHGQFIAGLKGYQATHLQAVRFSHPPFPVFSYLLASCIPLSHGSLIKLWGNWSPVSLCVLNVNYSQTRKSCLTFMAEHIVGPANQALVQRLEKIWDAKRKATDNTAGKAQRAKKEEREEDHGEDEIAAGALDEASRAAGEGGATNFPGVWSVSFLGGTIDRCKERGSGNFSQLKQTKSVMKLAPISKEVLDAAVGKATDADHSLAEKFGMSGRLWFSQVLLFDETYGFLQELSMLDVPNQRKGDDSASGQTPNGGWANRLLQCGKSDHETKTLGCHGGAGAPCGLSSSRELPSLSRGWDAERTPWRSRMSNKGARLLYHRTSCPASSRI